MFIESVTNVQTLMSNFLLLMRKGFSTYFCITKEQVFSLNFYGELPLDYWHWVLTSLISCYLFNYFEAVRSGYFYFSLSCLSFYPFSIFYPFYFYPFSFSTFYPFSLNFFLFINIKQSRRIFSNCSIESNISIPLPLFSPVGLSSHKQLFYE